MPSKAVVKARIDQQTRDEAATVLAAIGLTIPDAVRLLLARVAQDKLLPFEPLTPSAEAISAMHEARGGELPSFGSVEALLSGLIADD